MATNPNIVEATELSFNDAITATSMVIVSCKTREYNTYRGIANYLRTRFRNISDESISEILGILIQRKILNRGQVEYNGRKYPTYSLM